MRYRPLHDDACLKRHLADHMMPCPSSLTEVSARKFGPEGPPGSPRLGQRRSMQVGRGHGSGWERSSYDHQRFKGRLETPAHEFPSTYRRMYRARGPTGHRTMNRNSKHGGSMGESMGGSMGESMGRFMMGSPHLMDGKDGEKKMGKKWDLDGKILGLP